MSRSNEEFGGLLGLYLEGVSQAYHPVFSGNAQPRRERGEKCSEARGTVGKKAGASEECCSPMTPMLCGKS